MRKSCIQCGDRLYDGNTSCVSLSEDMCQECHTEKEEENYETK